MSFMVLWAAGVAVVDGVQRLQDLWSETTRSEAMVQRGAINTEQCVARAGLQL